MQERACIGALLIWHACRRTDSAPEAPRRRNPLTRQAEQGLVPAVQPGHVVGYNGKIAWSVTLGYTDVEDLFLERFDAHGRCACRLAPVRRCVCGLAPLCSTPMVADLQVLATSAPVRPCSRTHMHACLHTCTGTSTAASGRSRCARRSNSPCGASKKACQGRPIECVKGDLSKSNIMSIDMGPVYKSPTQKRARVLRWRDAHRLPLLCRRR